MGKRRGENKEKRKEKKEKQHFIPFCILKAWIIDI